MKKIKMKRDYSSMKTGEVQEVTEALADQLIRDGFAEAVGPVVVNIKNKSQSARQRKAEAAK